MPTESQPLELDEELTAAIGTAFETGNFITVGYIGDDGWAHLSRRGSTQVFGPQQLAIWVRKRHDGLAKAIAERPNVTLFYADMSKPQLYSFYGLGRLSTDCETDTAVYSGAPAAEQAQDPERAGVALIIELRRVQALGARMFVMERVAAS